MSCKGKYRRANRYYEEGNKVLIEKVEVFVKLVGDDNDRFYKIFDEEPKIELSSTVLHYSFDSFRQNLHWALHAYSSKCDGWSGDHDNSKFAKEVWEKIEEGNKRITNDLFSANFSCVDQRLFPSSVTPEKPSPDITTREDRDTWLNNNKPFAPPASKEECQPVTAESIADNASGTTVDPKCRLFIPDDLDDRSEENLEVLRDQMQRYVSAGEESNAGMKEEFDDLSNSGCFYDKELTDGITVEIEGQYLLDVAGKYMTEEKFKISKEGPPIDKVPIYINLGLDNRSYPLMRDFFEKNDGSVVERTIDLEYTKNFKVRDIAFVHLSRGGNSKQLAKYLPIEVKEWKESCWLVFSCSKKGNAKEIYVESGIVNIQRIALFLDEDEEPFYELEAGNQQENEETGVKGGLFTLNTIVNSWTDYNIKDNLAWKERRGNGCSE